MCGCAPCSTSMPPEPDCCPNCDMRINERERLEPLPLPPAFNQHGPGGYSDLEGLIHQIVGAASTCWSNLEGAGVFDDARARDVAEAALAEVKRYFASKWG